MRERFALSECFHDNNGTKNNNRQIKAYRYPDRIIRFLTSLAGGIGLGFCLSISPASATLESGSIVSERTENLGGDTTPATGQMTVQDNQDAWSKALEAIRANLPPEIMPPMVFSDLTSGLRAATDPNEVLAFDDRRVPRWLMETILHAAEVTETDPVYLMALADKESSFSWSAKAGTSTASGLFQFLNGTWLEMIREFGPDHNLNAEAEAIEVNKGKLSIKDPKENRRILDLRNNPYVASLMAAEMLKRDRIKVEKRLGREISRSEFYLAHFLGAGSASKLMQVSAERPGSAATKLFPKAAKANRTLFTKREGRKARSLSAAEFHQRVGSMMDQRIARYERVAEYVAEKR